ncbi:MAG: hypothetical protein ACXW3C_03695 [Pyrinomonadaceae bacterium]
MDLALKQTDQSQVPAELAQCASCREEFASLRNALRSTEVTMWLAEPADNFWPGYHERLRARLENNNQASNHPAPVAPGGFGPWLRKLATASIPVPVPVAAVLLAFIGSSLFFMVYARQSSSSTSTLTPPSIITKTVAVPVVQEKLVTRVVYRNARHAQREPATPERIDEAIDSRQMESPAVRTLEGFKPANEAKLTIIKGSEQDEK